VESPGSRSRGSLVPTPRDALREVPANRDFRFSAGFSSRGGHEDDERIRAHLRPID